MASGHLKVDGSRVKGSFGGTLGSASASGRCSANSLKLSVTGKNKDTGKTVRSSLTLFLSGSRELAQSVSTTDSKSGKRFRALTVSYFK